MNQQVMRDERTVGVENASYRWAYLVLSYGLLALTMYRSFVRDESAWDLLALVIIGGGVATSYQASNRVLSWRWARAAIMAAVLAALLAVVLAVVR